MAIKVSEDTEVDGPELHPLVVICIGCPRGIKVTNVYADELRGGLPYLEQDDCVGVYTACKSCRENGTMSTKTVTTTSYGGSRPLDISDTWSIHMSTHMCKMLRGDEICAKLGFNNVVWPDWAFMHTERIRKVFTAESVSTKFYLLLHDSKIISVNMLGTNTDSFM